MRFDPDGLMTSFQAAISAELVRQSSQSFVQEMVAREKTQYWFSSASHPFHLLHQ
jgi:hypothetical protein